MEKEKERRQYNLRWLELISEADKLINSAKDNLKNSYNSLRPIPTEFTIEYIATFKALEKYQTKIREFGKAIQNQS